jgi:hypothetical protein
LISDLILDESLRIDEYVENERELIPTRVYSGSAAALSVPDIVAQLPLPESQY